MRCQDQAQVSRSLAYTVFCLQILSVYQRVRPHVVNKNYNFYLRKKDTLRIMPKNEQ